MSVEAGELYNIIAGDSSVEQKANAVNTLKTEVKRSLVQLDNVMGYFEALVLATNSQDSSIHAVSFSCICHLVKRVITQDQQALQEPARIVLPVILDKFGDQKASVKATARRVFDDYWMACPAETEEALLLGLDHPDHIVRWECLDALKSRVSIQESKFAFRPFTSPVIVLLNDHAHEDIRVASEELLVMFFKSAHARAKQDLARELGKLANKTVSTRILKAVGYSPPNNSSSSSSTPSASSRSAPMAKGTNSRSASHNEESATLSIKFITADKAYQTEKLPAVNVAMAEDLHEECEDMLPAFEGKETEHNWLRRENSIKRLRGFVSGNAPTDFPDDMAAAIKAMSDAICKAVSSLRTTLSGHGCSLVREAVWALGTRFDPCIEPILSNLAKLTVSTKKIQYQAAYLTVSAMILHTSYSLRYLQHAQSSLNEKGSKQLKNSAAIWIRLMICRHYRHKSVIESSGGYNMIRDTLQRGVADADAGVREAMRSAFWSFNEVWPKEARNMMEKFDDKVKKALERGNPAAAKTVATAAPRAKPTTAARPDIKEFIAKSREEKAKRVPASNSAPIKQDVGLNTSKQPGRLGMPQRNRVPPSSASASSASSSSSSTAKRAPPPPPPTTTTTTTTTTTKAAATAPVRSEPEPKKKMNKPSHPTVLELITTDDPSRFERGLNALMYLVKGVEPPAQVECYRPATMPRPDIVGRVLQRIFSTKKEEHIKMFIKPDVVQYMAQFVGSSLLLHSVVEFGQDVALRTVVKQMDKVGAFAELSVADLKPGVVGLLIELSHGVDGSDTVVQSCERLMESDNDSIKQMLVRLAGEHSEIEDAIHVLPKPQEDVVMEQANEAESEPHDSVTQDSPMSASEPPQTPKPEQVPLPQDDPEELHEAVEAPGEVEEEEPQVLEPEIKPPPVYEHQHEHDQGMVAIESDDEPAHDHAEQDADIEVDQVANESNETGSNVEMGVDPEPESEQEFVNRPSVEPEYVTESSVEPEAVKEPSIEAEPVKEASVDPESVKEPSVGPEEEAVKEVSAESKEETVKETSVEPEEESVEVEPTRELTSEPEESVKESTAEPEALEDEHMRDVEEDNEVNDGVDQTTAPIPANTEEPEPQLAAAITDESLGANGRESDVYGTPQSSFPNSPASDKENQTPVFKDLDQEMESKLNIHTDNSQTQGAPQSTTPSSKTVMAESNVNTPVNATITPQKKTPESQQGATTPSWYHFESKKQVCMSPLPQKEVDASRLFESLLGQLQARTIDAHGFRKLITIVRGARTGEAGVAFDTWRQEHRQAQLQSSLLEYLSDVGHLNESQINQGLLQLKQLLTIPDHATEHNSAVLVFQGCEKRIFDILMDIAGQFNANTVIYTAIRETQDEMVKNITDHDAVALLDGVIGAHEQSVITSHNRLQKMILVSTLGKLIVKVNEETMQPRLNAVSSIVLTSIADKETYVRKESYPVLVNLRQMLPQEIFHPLIADKLSEGQQHLMEYYFKKSGR